MVASLQGDATLSKLLNYCVVCMCTREWCKGMDIRPLQLISGPSKIICVRHPVLTLSGQDKTPGCLGREQSTGQVVRHRGRAVLTAMLGKERKEVRKK